MATYCRDSLLLVFKSLTFNNLIMGKDDDLEVFPPIDGPYDGFVGIEIDRDRVWGYHGWLSLKPAYNSGRSENSNFYFTRNPLIYVKLTLLPSRDELGSFVIYINYQRNEHISRDDGCKESPEKYFINISKSGEVNTDLPETLGGVTYGHMKFEPLNIDPSYFIMLCLIGIKIFSKVVGDEEYSLGYGAGRTVRNDETEGPFKTTKELDIGISGLPEEIEWGIRDNMQGNTPSVIERSGVPIGDYGLDGVMNLLNGIYSSMEGSLQLAMERLSQD